MKPRFNSCTTDIVKFNRDLFSFKVGVLIILGTDKVFNQKGC